MCSMRYALYSPYGLNFNWHGRKAIIIINKIINLTLASIVIIKEFMTVSD